MNKTQLSQFTLQKVKIKGQGLEVDFGVEEATAAEIYHDEKKVKSDKNPHPDLLSTLNACSGFMAEIFYFNTLKELRDSNVFMASAEQAGMLNEKFEALKQKITITGIGLSGKDENRGIIITAKLKLGTGHEVAINSQRIKFGGAYYGFEESLENLMTDLEEEVYEYIINGKQAQLEMFFNTDGEKAADGGNEIQFDEDEEDLAEQAFDAMQRGSAEEE